MKEREPQEIFNTKIKLDNIEIDPNLVLDNLPRLVMLIGLDGTILYWNGGGKYVFGYTSEEVVGRHVDFLYPGRNKQTFVRDLYDLNEGKTISGEWKGRHKNGSTVWVDVKRVLVKTESGEKLVLGSASDINRQKKIEMELKESRARSEAILETTVDGVITIDEQGVINGFNKSAERIFGYQEENVIGKKVNILMPEYYASRHNEYIHNYLESDEKHIIGIGREVTGKRKDGSTFPMELAVSEVMVEGERFFTGMVRDISQRRELEQEILEVSEEERRSIGQDLHDGLGQMLTGIGLISKNLARKLEVNGLPGADEVREIANMIREADEMARDLAHGLIKVDLEEHGLSEALGKLCSQAARFFNIQCIYSGEEGVELSHYTDKLNVYRIAQEAISNAAKHGQAKVIEVNVKRDEKFITLIVEDNGKGFDQKAVLKQKKGMGIHIMRYRAGIMSGYLDITESPEGKTRVMCKIPIQSNQT